MATADQDDGPATPGRDGPGAGGRPLPGDVGLAALAALIIMTLAVRRGLAFANADALVSALISTEHLTFFYWGQDRLASVVALMASPIRATRANYLAQTTVLATAYVVLTFMMVRFHARRVRSPVATRLQIGSALAAGSIALLLVDRSTVYVLALEQHYAFSATLFLGGLAMLSTMRPVRVAAGVVSMVAATLVIPPVVAATPIVVVMHPPRHVARRTALAAAVSAGALACSVAASARWGAEFAFSESYQRFELDRLTRGAPHVLNAIADSVDTPWAVVVGLACIGTLWHPSTRPTASQRLAYVIAGAIAVAWWAVFTANEWVEINQFSYRYFFPVYALGLFVLTGTTTGIAARFATRRDDAPLQRTGAVAVAAALVVAVIAYVAALNRTTIPAVADGERLAAAASSRDVDLLIGDYWQVWPAMFADRADGGGLIAVTTRSEALRHQIDARAADGALVAWCLDLDETACVGRLRAVTGRLWSLDVVRSVDPLVVEFTAAS